MHISEGFLPAAHAIGWTIVAAPFAGFSIRAVSRRLTDEPRERLQLAAVAGFAFSLSALKLPSVSGSCSHPTGSGLGAILAGPVAMPAIGLIVLLFQALLLAHGGLTTLGANLFSLSVVGPWVSWVLLRGCERAGVPRDPGVCVSAAAGSLATYATTALQLALAYPDAQSGVAGAFLKYTAIFSFTQLPLAISEGLLTVVVARTLARARFGIAEAAR